MPNAMSSFREPKQVDEFEKLVGQIESLYAEIHELAKKKPNDLLNTLKLKMVNGLLKKSTKYILKAELPLEGFTSFTEDDLPSYSDVQIVLSQYLACLESVRTRNITFNFGTWYWIIGGNQSEKRTKAPKSLK